MKERRNIKRREFIDQYFPYVKKLVFRYSRSLPVGLEVQDLVNSGVIGLILAADNYEEEKAGKDFMSYANFRIKGEIIGALRIQDPLSRQMRDKIKIYLFWYSKLQQEFKRDPTNDEIKKETKFTEKEMKLINSAMSMDISDFTDEMIIKESVDYFTDVDDLVDKISDKEIIRIKLPEAINKLSEKEQHVIREYYLNADTKKLKQIGEELNVTESRVSQIRSQALIKLKNKLNEIRDSA